MSNNINDEFKMKRTQMTISCKREFIGSKMHLIHILCPLSCRRNKNNEEREKIEQPKDHYMIKLKKC